ncbi:MAG: prepilin-type N-terminal cleavage/methylation domain-containing protein [Actinomycetota bacterium]|nr:prepilin-type N-terminal cleavage/methylation domain-containing protein [Actinomycetota bacterium]
MAQGRAKDDELGFSLIEVLIAMSVLLVVLLPAADLLISTGSVIAVSKFRTQAQGIASKELASIQLLAANQTGLFTTVPFAGLSAATPAIAVPSVANGTVSWNRASASVSETVDNEQFSVYVDGDWCTVADSSAGSGSAGAYANAAATAMPQTLAFVVAIDVLWDHTTLAGGTSVGTHYVEIGTVQPPGGWPIASSSSSTGLPATGLPVADVANCPAGLT